MYLFVLQHIFREGVFQSFDLLFIVGPLLDEGLLVVEVLWDCILAFILQVFIV